ncbi:unnamed protein product [Musa hybrid cultivar]
MGREWQWSTTASPKGDSKESNSGCMGGMLHYLHFHQLLYSGSGRNPPGSPPSLSLLPRIELTSQQATGLEAPRNSLELDEGKASSSTSAIEDELYDVPVGIEIASASLSKSSKKMMMWLEEEKRSSQAETPRTPGVVARLMGLDTSAGQASSPSPRTPPAQSRVRNKKQNGGADQSAKRESRSPRLPLGSLNCNVAASTQIRSVDAGSRYLPETPRVSSAWSCDVDPRFSLRLNKENTNKGVQEIGHLRDFRGHQDENKSRRRHHGTREFTKQVKEGISIRQGGGGGGGRGRGHSGEDESKSKSKRTRPAGKKLSMEDPPSPRSSPQTRKLEIASGTKKPIMLSPKPLQSQATDRLPPSKTSRDHGEAKALKKVLDKCKKADNERFTERIRKPAQSPTTTRPSCSRLLPTIASLFQSTDSLPETNIPDKSRFSALPSQPISRSFASSSSFAQQSDCQKNSHGRALRYNDPKFRYVKTILERAGLDGAHTWRWYSPSLPIDPIVFHQLEPEFPFFLGERSTVTSDRLLLGPLRYRWNRKLLFHLVEEKLGDLLLGCREISSFFSTTTTRLVRDNGQPLLRQLWAQIENLPAGSDCRVVADIDALVAADLPEAIVRRLLRHPAVANEASDVVVGVEQGILDGLLAETAASLALSSAAFQS